jgi:hypothetical protein
MLTALPQMVGRVPYSVGGVESTTEKASLHSALQLVAADTGAGVQAAHRLWWHAM